MVGVLSYSFVVIEHGVRRHRYCSDQQEASPQHDWIFLTERVGDTHGHANYDADGRQDVLQVGCSHGLHYSTPTESLT